MSEPHSFDTIQARLQRRVDTSDRGQQLPATRAALELTDTVARLEALVTALGSERVLVAAQVADTQQQGQPCHRLTQVESDGEAVSAAFTCTDTLAGFDKTARPVPVSAAEAAQIALLTTGGRMCLDPPGLVRLPRAAVVALAQGLTWVPPWKDKQLVNHLCTVAGEAVAYLRLLPTASSVQVVRVGVAAGSTRLQVESALAKLAADPQLTQAGEKIELQPVVANLA
ncbi:MAG: SseB family protein [Actinomycetaceae bacterium]|nr:SseB family protein [Actinomycetaceae bacterium]